MKLVKLSIIFTLVFWPAHLFLSNTPADFLSYFLPAVLLGISLFLYPSSNYFWFLLAIGLIQPKLALFPLLVSLLFFLIKKQNLLFLLLSAIIFIFNLKPFQAQSILHYDHNKTQEVISRTQLYPNSLLARTFHNKARIYLDKTNERLFALTDINNYFFSFHPRENILENQNLVKFPFVSIIFFLVGLFYLNKHPKFIFLTLIAASLLTNLSMLNIYDRNDFILWPILAAVIIFGAKTPYSSTHRLANITSAVLLLFAGIEFIRLFL